MSRIERDSAHVGGRSHNPYNESDTLSPNLDVEVGGLTVHNRSLGDNGRGNNIAQADTP